MDRIIDDIIYLIYILINKVEKDNNRIQNLDLDGLFTTSAFHQLTSIVAYALDYVGIKDARFVEEKYRTIAQSILYAQERKKIYTDLQKAHIWYMPLKGIIMQNYYPHFGMRQMCDNDILYDSKHFFEVKRIMESHGFIMSDPDGIVHQEVYHKQPFFIFEMHPMLFDDWTDHKYCIYYDNIQSMLLGEGEEKHFSNEDFYIYLVTHEHKHYYWRGTGIRPLLDTYIFLKHFDGKLNWDYINTETRKIGIDKFEECNRLLAIKVFGTGNYDDLNTEEKVLFQDFVSSGAGGNRENNLRNQIKQKGIIGFLKERVFLPPLGVKYRYPFFYRHKLLLPFLPLYRFFRGWNNAIWEIKGIFRIIYSKWRDRLH